MNRIWLPFPLRLHVQCQDRKIVHARIWMYTCSLSVPSPSSPPSPFLVRCGAIKTEIILCKMFCVLLPLLGPSSPRSACQRSSLRESFAGSAPIAATSRVAATGRSRLSHSQSFAFGSPLFGARFSFSFCLNKKILNLIFLRVSCSLTISESLSRMRVADSALLSTLCFASSRLLHRRDHPRTLVALWVCVSVCVRVSVCVGHPPTRSCLCTIGSSIDSSQARQLCRPLFTIDSRTEGIIADRVSNKILYFKFKLFKSSSNNSNNNNSLTTPELVLCLFLLNLLGNPRENYNKHFN